MPGGLQPESATPETPEFLGSVQPVPVPRGRAPDGNRYTLIGVEVEDVQKLRNELGIVVRKMHELEGLVNDALDQILRIFKDAEGETDSEGGE